METSTKAMTLTQWLETQPEPAAPPIDTQSARKAIRGGLGNLVYQALQAETARSPESGLVLADLALARGHYREALAELERPEIRALDETGTHLMMLECHRHLGLPGDPDPERTWNGDDDFDTVMARTMVSPRDWPTFFVLINRIYAQHGEIVWPDPKKPLAFGSFSARPGDPVEGGPRISVLMPAYNAAPYVGLAIESILRQSWRNLELIVVDDCSTDDTASIAEGLAAADPRLLVLRQPVNKGAYAARNAGLARASGDYVTVHDADDWAHPRRLEYQARAMEAGAAISSSASVRFDKAMFPEFRPGPRRYLNDTCFASFMYSRPLMAEMGGWDEVRFGGDAEFYSRACTFHGTETTRVLPGIPLTLTLSDEASLSGGRITGRGSTTYGARRQYIVAYKEWHRGLKGKDVSAYRISPGKRPFPAPNVMLERNGSVELDRLYIFDFTQPMADGLRREIEAGAGRIGAAHWPAFRAAMTNDQHAHVRKLVAANGLRVCSPGDTVRAGEVVFASPDILTVRPDSFADITAESFVVRGLPQ